VELASKVVTSGHIPTVRAAAVATEECCSIVRRVILFIVSSFGAMLLLVLWQECKTETQRAVVHIVAQENGCLATAVAERSRLERLYRMRKNGQTISSGAEAQ
jgi:hypothetical protein